MGVGSDWARELVVLANPVNRRRVAPRAEDSLDQNRRRLHLRRARQAGQLKPALLAFNPPHGRADKSGDGMRAPRDKETGVGAQPHLPKRLAMRANSSSPGSRTTRSRVAAVSEAWLFMVLRAGFFCDKTQ